MSRFTQNPDVDIQAELADKAEEIMGLLSGQDFAASQALVSQFVSELFFALAQKRQREERRLRQAEGIAAAKERGVRFGPSRKPLPTGFIQYYRAWQKGEMTLTQAAETCGMTRASFYRAVDRMKEMERCS